MQVFSSPVILQRLLNLWNQSQRVFYEEKTLINLLIWEKQCACCQKNLGDRKFLKSTVPMLQPNSWKLEAKKIWSISHITRKPNSLQSQTRLRGQSSSIIFYLQFTGQVWNFSMRMDRVRGVLAAGTERPSRRARAGTTSEALSSGAKHRLQWLQCFFLHPSLICQWRLKLPFGLFFKLSIILCFIPHGQHLAS